MSNLTPKQKKFLDFITNFQDREGYAPSQQEIAKHFGYSSLGTVQNYIVRLQRNGYLQKQWNARRGMSLVDEQEENPAPETVELPLLGYVAAGRPIEAVEQAQSLGVPQAMIRKQGKHFVLQVQGDSMIEDGINDGDYVLIRQQKVANTGDTVVALVNNEATIKRFYQQTGQVELRPANPNYDSLFVNDADASLRIEGILVGLVRHY